MVTLPSVLFVHVDRVRVPGLPQLSRMRVCLEEQFNVPMLGVMELAAVVCHTGKALTSGHYTCVCRGPNGMFYRFDDKSCVCLGVDLSILPGGHIVLLVYTAPDVDFAFARGAASVASGVAGLDAKRGSATGCSPRSAAPDEAPQLPLSPDARRTECSMSSATTIHATVSLGPCANVGQAASAPPEAVGVSVSPGAGAVKSDSRCALLSDCEEDEGVDVCSEGLFSSDSDGTSLESPCVFFDDLVLKYARAGIGSSIRAALTAEFGARVKHVVGSEWSSAWGGWEELRLLDEQFHSLSDADYIAHCRRPVDSLVRRFMHVAFDNCDVAVRSEAQAIRDLRSRFDMGVGVIWGNNECLADSLLQLMVHHGLLSGVMSLEMRERACKSNRAWLVGHADPMFRPRRAGAAGFGIDVEDAGAFLQDCVHAEPTVRFFATRFADRKSRALPPEGILLIVHSRYDSITLPASEMRICRDDDCGAVEPPVIFHLYNLTGRGYSGYHYDPLFPILPGGAAAGAVGEAATYTPDVIDADKCFGRTWAKGLGGQCSNLPAQNQRICRMHAKKADHGFVDGDIPEATLEKFRRVAAKGKP
jgi:hypothetical protein